MLAWKHRASEWERERAFEWCFFCTVWIYYSSQSLKYLLFNINYTWFPPHIAKGASDPSWKATASWASLADALSKLSCFSSSPVTAWSSSYYTSFSTSFASSAFASSSLCLSASCSSFFFCSAYVGGGASARSFCMFIFSHLISCSLFSIATIAPVASSLYLRNSFF